MKKIILKLLKLIPLRSLTKHLPSILAWIITRVLGYMLKKYPEKSEKVLETAQELTLALSDAVKSAEDGIITETEIVYQRALWEAVFE